MKIDRVGSVRPTATEPIDARDTLGDVNHDELVILPKEWDEQDCDVDHRPVPSQRRTRPLCVISCISSVKGVDVGPNEEELKDGAG